MAEYIMIYFSVIIPVYQDKEGLMDTVNSLLAGDFPKERYEIIVCDNNSKDGTKQVAMKLQEDNPALIRVVHQDEIQSSYATRNAGVKIARGEICCFIDADMTADSDYLYRVSRYFANDDQLMYFGCNVKIEKKANTISSLMNREYGFKMKKYFTESHFSPTACLSVRRAVFDKVGFFDERLESGGDKEFGQRVFAAGLKQYYDDDLVLSHPSRSTYVSMLKKYTRIARGHAQLVHYYPERYGYYTSECYYNIRRYAPPGWKLVMMPFVFIDRIVKYIYGLPIRIVKYVHDLPIRIVKYVYDLPIRICALAEFSRELRRLEKNNATKR